MGKFGVSGGLKIAVLVAWEADAEQAANLKHVDARPEAVGSPALEGIVSSVIAGRWLVGQTIEPDEN